MCVKTIKRSLRMMAAMMMAFATFTACEKPDDSDDDEIDDGNGVVAGKRIKEWVQTTTRPSDGVIRTVYTYNSDGSINRIDQYDEASKLTRYSIYTNHPDGRPDKIEQFFEAVEMQSMKNESVFTYDANKTLQKVQDNLFMNGTLAATNTTEYTFVNGRKTREEFTGSGGAVKMERVYEYDSVGKRTVTTETQNAAGIVSSRKYTRSYNADGTILNVTYPYNFMDNTVVTTTLTWENGKKAVNEDVYLAW